MARSTASKKAAYIEAIASGVRVGDAAEFIEVDRTLPYVWERIDPEFAERIDAARRSRFGQVKDKVFELAMDGSERLLMRLYDAYEASEQREVAREQQVGEVIIIMPGSVEYEDVDRDFISLE